MHGRHGAGRPRPSAPGRVVTERTRQPRRAAECPPHCDDRCRGLTRDGRADLAEQVRHVSVLEGDGAGYDILSFDQQGQPNYIEVKTTTGARESDFFVSAAEVAFSERNAERYRLYRVFRYTEVTDTGECYILEGALTKGFTLIPMQFRARR